MNLRKKQKSQVIFVSPIAIVLTSVIVLPEDSMWRNGQYTYNTDYKGFIKSLKTS